ncbi:hypothetical protein FACS1894132_07020 [Clostridia bacterium]|nr:hypothetical protein FACS1894132_07020 [Clostridia bacterium]
MAQLLPTRLDLETAREIISNHTETGDIILALNNIQKFPDSIIRNGMTEVRYNFDGNDELVLYFHSGFVENEYMFDGNKYRCDEHQSFADNNYYSVLNYFSSDSTYGHFLRSYAYTNIAYIYYEKDDEKELLYSKDVKPYWQKEFEILKQRYAEGDFESERLALWEDKLAIGEVTENSLRLDIETARKIVAENFNSKDLITVLNNAQKHPDVFDSGRMLSSQRNYFATYNIDNNTRIVVELNFYQEIHNKIYESIDENYVLYLNYETYNGYNIYEDYYPVATSENHYAVSFYTPNHYGDINYAEMKVKLFGGVEKITLYNNDTKEILYDKNAPVQQINISDLVIMMKYQTGDLILTIPQKQKYDYNSDGLINAVDFAIAKRKLLKALQ